MRNSPMEGVTSDMTLPGAIRNSEVIGCDSLLAPGRTYVIDYDASNSPGFAHVAARLTDNVDDIVWFGGAHVDGSLHVLTISAGDGTLEHNLTDARANGGTSTGGFTGPDFAAFALDFVRLRVSEVQMSLSTTTAASSALSPPIAFASDRDGNIEIYVMNADGTGPTRLTVDPAQDILPDWSPDGSKIAFVSGRDGNFEIYTMNADGSGLIRRTNNPALDVDPEWSPDGSKIVFESDRGGSVEIYVMNADGTGQVNLTNNPAFDANPSWSPDGSKIAFRSTRDGNDELYVMNADGTGLVRVTNDLESGPLDEQPSWSPDGSKLVFVSDRGGTSEIYTINVNGTERVKLTTNLVGEGDIRPDWSSSGRIVFQSDRDGGAFQIYVMNPDGTGLVRLTNNLTDDEHPSWGSVSSLNTSFSYSWEFWGKRAQAR